MKSKHLWFGSLGRLGVVAIVIVLVIGGVSASRVNSQSAPVFSYSGDNGPGFWAGLDPANWEACAGEGGRQSPIDITNVKIDSSLKPLDLNLEETPIALINNGHTIEEEYELGSTLIFKGVTYTLAQFHFHALSEHAIGGVRGVMEIHAVFKDNLVNTTKYAVVGMLYKIGHENPFLAKLIASGLPIKEGDRVDSPVEINLAEGFTDTSAYYTYAGSLTTPPCTEAVTWLVLKRPAEMSAGQFQAMDKILGDNFRPLQERNGRVVWATAKGGVGPGH